MAVDYLTLKEEAGRLAQQLCGKDTKKGTGFTSRLLDICTRAQDKDVLLIHNPGGWGNTELGNCLEWERSIVEGVSSTIERLGHTPALVSYLRSGTSLLEIIKDIKEQTDFFALKSKILAAQLEFITQHFANLKVILVGISQGAAFGNSTMRHLRELGQVYSIELGLFFPHMPRRVITERTLAIDSNGIMPDPMSHRNLWAGFRAYVTAPCRWIKYKVQGKPQKLTYCINVPGHEYRWEYPEVQKQIKDFLNINLGNRTRNNVEVGTS